MTGPVRLLQAIVLDFDGVMADTEPLHLRAFQQALLPHGVALPRAAYYERYLGYDDGGVFRAVARDRGLRWTEGDIALLLTQKTEHFRLIVQAAPDVLFEGVCKSVQEWSRVAPVAIASGALRAEIELILAATRLQDSVSAIVAAGETPNGKPAPDPYAAALARLGADPARSVAVEDSVCGIESARAAGMKVVALPTSYPRERLTAADAIVETFQDLSLCLFEELAGR